MSKKIIIICVVVILLIVVGIIAVNKANIFGKKATKLEMAEDNTVVPIKNDTKGNKVEPTKNDTESITVVPTMDDTITADSSWCGTFQLVWNDMKNEVVKKDIVFNPQLDMVENLNKEDFNESMLSEDYYFKIYGLKTLALKEKIEKGIKEKFNQTSDILDDFDWSEEELDDPNNTDIKRYFFYTMLYRKFEFLQEFDKLDNDKFGNEYKDVEYFGIDKNTEDSVGNQITVLYYNSKDDFAILINTKTNDEVIFCKNPTGNNFNEIYKNMNDESSKYKGSKSFEDIDEFKAPKLTFNEKREYTELANKKFKTADPIYDTAEIQKAIQTIKFSLDEKGGEVKSEAAIDMKMISTSIDSIIEEDEPRYFYVDDTFAIFLREKGKSKPYFAGRVDDITKFQ